jgi:succinate dehydrogenase/fumarate reductase iron-sulfur protein
MNTEWATVRILRQDGLHAYRIPYESGKTVLEALEYIYTHLDGSLGWRYFCRAGYCVGCTMEVNGKPTLACTTYMTKDMTIKPLAKKQVVRDLITELDDSSVEAG